MIKYVHSFLMVICFTYTLIAQGYMVNKLEHVGQTIYDIEANDESEVWAVGQNLTLYSEDSGDTWEHIYFETLDEELKFIIPYSREEFVVMGSSIYRTNDAGQSWTTVSTDIQARSKVSFGSTIFIIGPNFGLMRSEDKGMNWLEISPTSFDYPESEMSFVSESIGYVSDESGNILKTTDSGDTWVQVNETTFPSLISQIAFKDETEGYLKIEKDLYQTLNGGVTWTIINDSSGSGSGLFVFPSGLYELYSSRVRVFDSNWNWDYVLKDDENDNDLTLDFEENGDMQFASGNGMILRKAVTDELLDWDDLTPGPNNGFDQIDINGSTMFITGQYRFQLSNDDGDTFVQGKPAGFSLDSRILVDDNGDLYTCDGQLRRSIDQGENWDFLVSASAFFKLPSGKIVYGHSNNKIASTSDFGENIQELYTVDGLMRDIYFSSENDGWAMTTSSKSYRTKDGGETWEEIVHQFLSPNRMQFVNDDIGYGIQRYNNTFFKTTSGGDEWIQTSIINLGIRVTDLYFMDEVNGWICGEKAGSPAGVIFQTKDGGQSWNLFQNAFAPMMKLDYDKVNNILWAVGKNAQLYNYSVCSDLTPTLSLEDDRLTCNEDSESYKWFLNDDFLVETTSPYIDLIENGIYTVRILGEEYCVSDISEEISFNMVSSQNIHSELGINIYPNPSHGELNVEIEDLNDFEIKVYTLTGINVLVDVTKTGSSAHIRDLEKGSYFIEVITTESRIVKKVIVEY